MSLISKNTVFVLGGCAASFSATCTVAADNTANCTCKTDYAGDGKTCNCNTHTSQLLHLTSYLLGINSLTRTAIQQSRAHSINKLIFIFCCCLLLVYLYIDRACKFNNGGCSSFQNCIYDKFDRASCVCKADQGYFENNDLDEGCECNDGPDITSRST